MEIASVPNTAALIAADLANALSTVTQNQKKVFSVVSVVDDEASFTRVADPIAAPSGAVIGIVGGSVEEKDGTCDLEILARCPFSVLIRIERQRKPGEGEQTPLAEMARLAEIAKQAILQDRSRGGLCNLISWNGSLINGTEVTGNFQPVRRVANQSFFTASLPVVCGWIVSR
jgi:hypothetical protein